MVRIFTEGRDAEFLKYYCKYLEIDQAVELDFIPVGGYTSLHLVLPKFKETTDFGGRNLVIFDVDNPANGGGLLTRTGYLEEQKRALVIEFNSFLFPNNEDDGDFEDLLAKIGNHQYVQIFGCFEHYTTCIRALIENGFTILKTPLKKSKIYAYVDAFTKTEPETKRFKKQDFLFEKDNIWDLESTALVPLKRFLIDNIVSK